MRVSRGSVFHSFSDFLYILLHCSLTRKKSIDSSSLWSGKPLCHRFTIAEWEFFFSRDDWAATYADRKIKREKSQISLCRWRKKSKLRSSTRILWYGNQFKRASLTTPCKKRRKKIKVEGLEGLFGMVHKFGGSDYTIKSFLVEYSSPAATTLYVTTSEPP